MENGGCCARSETSMNPSGTAFWRTTISGGLLLALEGTEDPRRYPPARSQFT